MRILMVCLGNICRSPLAEGIMQDLIKKYNKNWSVDSAGTGSWHIGSRPDPRSIEIAAVNGIDISHQKARMFTEYDFKEFDVIYAMDEQNLSDMKQLAENSVERKKVSLLLGDNNVEDPYFADGAFEGVFNKIRKACELRVKELSELNNE